MRTLEKVITRDKPLIAAEFLYQGIVKETQKFFGFPFFENVVIYRNGTFENWREARMIWQKLPRQMAKWVAVNRHKLDILYQRLKTALDYYQRFKIKHQTTSNLLKNLLKVGEYTSKGTPALFCSLWIPV